jgi:hypothetical protein
MISTSKPRKGWLALLCCWACAFADAAQAQSLGLKFAATDPDAATSSLNPTDVAGVVPTANWNNLTGNIGTGVTGLSYDNGGSAVASTATVDWTSPNTWRSTTGNNSFPAGPDRVLTAGYLDSNDTAAGGVSITVNNLDAALRSPAYDVYVYFVSDSGANRGGAYTINDGTVPQIKYGSTLANPTMHVEDPGTDADLSIDGTYLRFQGLTGSSFTLTSNTTLTTPNGFRAPVNAIQIVGGSTPALHPSLVVNTVTGAVALKNNLTTPLSIDYYEISSAAGRLSTTGWQSLDDQNKDAGLAADFDNSGAVNGTDLGSWKAAYGTTAGGDADGDGDSDGADFLLWQRQVGQSAGPGDSWDEAGGISSNLLVELFLNGQTTIAPGAQVAIGNAFTPGAAGDLVFRFGRKGDPALAQGAVEYVTTGPATAVPEPMSLAVAMVFAAVGAVTRGRRRQPCSGPHGQGS